ncbi:hypothetical protein TNCV_148181 [Trichonephila clavipes]|nr:hypothetical protein TNCV_148181 [Trichonephila clavipes]
MCSGGAPASGSDPAFIVERHTAISQGRQCGEQISWGYTIIFSGPSRHFDSSQIRGRYFNADFKATMLSSSGAIYQQDNARPHTARLSQQCLQGI